MSYEMVPGLVRLKAYFCVFGSCYKLEDNVLSGRTWGNTHNSKRGSCACSVHFLHNNSSFQGNEMGVVGVLER